MNRASDSKASSIATADDSAPGYKPPPEFEEVEKDPLVGISMTDSTELWLIQWPVNQLQPDDLKGQQLSLKLQNNGKMASFESSVGKISRRVCLIHYPEPGELEKPGRPGFSRQMSSGSSLKGRSGVSSVVQMQRSSETINKMQTSSEMRNESSPGTTPTHSSKKKSSLSDTSSAKQQKSSKRNYVGDSQLLDLFTEAADQGTQDSGQQSAPASSGYTDHSHEGDSKKKKKKNRA
ncbi:hypothetical protein ACLOJK_019594 [Asimina triloba]